MRGLSLSLYTFKETGSLQSLQSTLYPKPLIQSVWKLDIWKVLKQSEHLGKSWRKWWPYKNSNTAYDHIQSGDRNSRK